MILSRINEIPSNIQTIKPALSKFTLYPNPANHFIKLRSLEAKSNYSWILFDTLGNTLMQKTNYTDADLISVQHLVSGIYYIKVYSEEMIISEVLKFVKR